MTKKKTDSAENCCTKHKKQPCLHTCRIDHVVDCQREPGYTVLVLIKNNRLRGHRVDLKRRPIAVRHGSHEVGVYVGIVRSGWPRTRVEEGQVHGVFCLRVGVDVHEATVVHVLRVGGGGAGAHCLGQAAARCAMCLGTVRDLTVSSGAADTGGGVCTAQVSAVLLALVWSCVYQNSMRTATQFSSISRIPRQLHLILSSA